MPTKLPTNIEKRFIDDNFSDLKNLKQLDKTIDQQAKKYSVMDEAFRRPVIRDMLLNDTRINLPENIRKYAVCFW